MDCFKQYKYWLESDYFDADTKAELKRIENNPKEIEERFYKELEFGTGGLRGIIGAGTNRMNRYTVRKASQGVANYLIKKGEDARNKGIVIAYDSRRMSREFAMEAGMVFTGNGIRTYIFDELRPTPELSFAVRFLGAAAGIVITASHNPKEYNGYKVYGEDGAQLSLDGTNAIFEEINKITDIAKVNILQQDEAIKKGLLKTIGKEIDREYIACLRTLSVNPGIILEMTDDFKIVYTPLHGAGNKLVRGLLAEAGFKNVLVVKEQEEPDAEFSTVRSPNPEDRSALTMAIEMARREDADITIATDPDSDRVGVAVKNLRGEYVILTGNQTGCLLMEYILSQKKARGRLPANGFVVKTIVTTELARLIAQNYGIELVEVLTGFKFIGEKIKELDDNGDKKFIFGFEESIGFLAGTFSRDKDGVVSSMLIAEMAAYYRSRNMTLYEGLIELYGKYGYVAEDLTTYTLEGKEGMKKIDFVMSELRNEKHRKFNCWEVSAIRDYLRSERYDMVSGKIDPLTLPQSNVLYYEMRDNSWFCIRPSGTEPKIKIYYGVSGETCEIAEKKLESLKNSVLEVVNTILR